MNYMSCYKYARLFRTSIDSIPEVFHRLPGIGIKFINAPINNDEFIRILEKQSCPPIITRQILDDLISNGVRIATVMRHLPFHEIESDLAEIGVSTIIVPPIDSSHQRVILDSNHEAIDILIKNKDVQIKSALTDEYISKGIYLFEKYGKNISKEWR